jgi:hypothetical protein
MKKQQTLCLFIILVWLIAGCTNSDNPPRPQPAIVVNSIEDIQDPPDGTVTLRSALARAASGQTIVFDENLDGGTIELSIIGDDLTILKGEVMGMRMEPSGPVSYLIGYFERDYGRSALYARKNVVIDASDLPAGITLSWAGGVGNDARVLAVYGNLTMKNIAVTGGRSVTEDISTNNPDQPWTLGRGGGVAVWGVAHLQKCKLYDNYCQGDFDSSRDRGAFGGGLYANIVILEDCIISGNTVLGGGAAGGGVYSVGGADSVYGVSTIRRSTISGNRISAIFTYGGGVYSDGGGIGNRKTLELINTTVARNKVEPAPGMSSFILGMGYWRGGGIYMSNGFLSINNCTIVENEVHGVPRTDDLGKPNLAGGIAATIGNAHAVEDLVLGYSIVAGNTVHELDTGYKQVGSYAQDIFTGSLFYFRSMGYNRIGVIDFSQMLVPIGQVNWASLSRRHYPKSGDVDGVYKSDILNLDSGITHSDTILSAGTDAPNPAVLFYEPKGSTLDRAPPASETIDEVIAEYQIASGGTNNFLEIILSRIDDHYGLGDPTDPNDFAAGFTVDFEVFLTDIDGDGTNGNQQYADPGGNPITTLSRTLWFGPVDASGTWPKMLYNYPYIEFWHRLDEALSAEDIPGMGPELLGDQTWESLFPIGIYSLVENPSITMRVWADSNTSIMEPVDQLGNARPANTLGDIGAIEIP